MFDGVKYRNEVTTQIHAILMLMPHLKSLTSQLKDAINAYRWFANYAQAVTANQRPEHPEDVPPPLAAVIGFAFWYLLVAVQQNRLSEKCCRIFVVDVVGMLRGKSQDERRSDREQLD